MGFELLLSALALVAPQPTKTHAVVGHSSRGVPIRAVRTGVATSPHKVLVVGVIHGNETAGSPVVRRLIRRASPTGFDLWLVRNFNPDGTRLGVRQNARGVDLNRNFGSEWVPIGRPWDPEYSGPRPWSEPETRAARRLVLDLRPDLTIWFHQPQRIVRAWGPSRAGARDYARLAHMRYRSIRWPPGTASNWQNHRFRGTTSFVVELAPGPLSARGVRRHARAVVALARLMSGTTTTAAG
jgi:murein peptide amidase A